MRWFAPSVERDAPAPAVGLIGRLFGRGGGDEMPPPATVERFGGVPAGLPPARWPKCAECGRSMTLLAQLAHQAERLDLGAVGRTLFVFQCMSDPGVCNSWDQSSGANAAFVVEAGVLAGGPTPLPADQPPLDAGLTITGWTGHDDGIAPEDRGRYMDERSIWAMTDEERDRATACVRLGGVPTWIQSPGEAPAGWRFVGQIDSADRAVYSADAEPNFGDAGIAYLFLLDRDGTVPDARMFWQCG